MRDRTRLGWGGLWLFGLLGLGLVAQIADFRPNDIEQGLELEAPEFTPSRFLDDDYFAEIDAWLSDDFALRGAGLRARAAVDYELLGDSTIPELVTVGDDDWLFYSPYLDPDCSVLDEAEPPALSASLDVWFVVTVPKAAYHAESLADPEAACVAAARAARLERFAGRTVDVDDGLVALVDRGVDVFLRDDTHWSLEARVSVARAFVESLAPGLWDDENVTNGEVQRLAALAAFMGIGRSGDLSGPVSILDVAVVESRYVSLNGELLVQQVSTSDLDGAAPGVTYLIGDSQMAFVVPLIAPYFEELHFVNWLVIESFGFPANNLPEADRLLVQTNRDACGRPAQR